MEVSAEPVLEQAGGVWPIKGCKNSISDDTHVISVLERAWFLFSLSLSLFFNLEYFFLMDLHC